MISYQSCYDIYGIGYLSLVFIRDEKLFVKIKFKQDLNFMFYFIKPVQ